MWWRMRFLTLLLLPNAVFAQDIQLAFPVGCIIGTNCHFQQFVDHDPTHEAADFQCGTLSYDGHKGTDIALPSLAAQANGVPVRAAAPGTVTAVRDALPDILQTAPDAPDVTGEECGNGVVISHPNGWETQYCHLARDSIAVTVGQEVKTHTVLGQIGLSGNTTFPHLHFELRRSGEIVDPFDPDGSAVCDARAPQSLWHHPLPIHTPPGGLIASGIAADVPTYEAIKAGIPPQNTVKSDAPLVLWSFAFGSHPGDVVIHTIIGPDRQTIFEDTEVLTRTQAQFYRANGRQPPLAGWPTGQYSAIISMMRDGRSIDSAVIRFDVAP